MILFYINIIMQCFKCINIKNNVIYTINIYKYTKLLLNIAVF